MITVRQGSRGDAVRQLQELLGITADGIFGPITKAAVKEYQSANGLKADGIVGPLTWGKLLGEEQDTSDKVVYKKPVDYKQYDSRWATKIPSVKALKDRLDAQENSSKMRSRCACMRKMLLVCRAVVVSGKPFDKKYNQENSHPASDEKS